MLVMSGMFRGYALANGDPRILYNRDRQHNGTVEMIEWSNDRDYRDDRGEPRDILFVLGHEYRGGFGYLLKPSCTI